MLIVAIAAILAFVTEGGADRPASGDGCPPAQTRAEARIQNLLSLPGIYAAGFDLGSSSTSGLRLLTNPSDQNICRALWAAMEREGTAASEGDRVSFFVSGNRYFVPIAPRPAPPGEIRIGERGGIEVYDQEFRLVARFAA